MPKNKERMMEADNNTVLTEMTKKIRLKRYSQKTLKAYAGHIRRFMEYTEADIDDLTSEQAPGYFSVECLPYPETHLQEM